MKIAFILSSLLLHSVSAASVNENGAGLVAGSSSNAESNDLIYQENAPISTMSPQESTLESKEMYTEVQRIESAAERLVDLLRSYFKKRTFDIAKIGSDIVELRPKIDSTVKAAQENDISQEAKDKIAYVSKLFEAIIEMVREYNYYAALDVPGAEDIARLSQLNTKAMAFQKLDGSLDFLIENLENHLLRIWRVCQFMGILLEALSGVPPELKPILDSKYALLKHNVEKALEEMPPYVKPKAKAA